MIKFTKFLVLLSAFALSSSASADSNGYTGGSTTGYQGAYCPAGYSGPLVTLGGHNALSYSFRGYPTPIAGGPTDTALFFHRRGARLFDKQNFEAAERAFEASLRAQGGTLKEDTLLYLAHIAIENGDMSKAEAYAKKYARAAGKKILETPPPLDKSS